MNMQRGNSKTILKNHPKGQYAKFCRNFRGLVKWKSALKTIIQSQFFNRKVTERSNLELIFL